MGHVFADRAALLVARDAWCANPEIAYEEYGAIGTWDISRITDLSWVFCADSDTHGDCNPACQSFNDDISGWDVSNVESLGGTFYQAYVFNQPIGNWNTARLINMGATFNDAYAFNQPIGNWNTARVEDVGWTFANALAFNQPLNNWNTARVWRMEWAFHNTPALSDENKALIASTWSASPAWCTDPEVHNDDDGTSWGGCSPGAGIFLGPIAALVVVCALLCIVKKWLRKREHNRKMAADRKFAGNQVPQAVTQIPMAAVPMQQPMMVPVMVSCPLGLKPGDMLPVQSPNGQMMQVQVPPGVMAGGQFAVQMPAAPTVAMAAPVQAVDTSGVAMAIPVS